MLAFAAQELGHPTCNGNIRDVNQSTGVKLPSHIHTAYERAGEFNSSNELLNQIYAMVTRTYESLTLGGYVVDCPTRERLGYGGDAGTSIETGMLNFSAGGLYSRWLANWRDAQDPTGSLPHTAPNYQDQGGGGPMWGGMVVTLPWQMYLQYGDRRTRNELSDDPEVAWIPGVREHRWLLLDHKSHAMNHADLEFPGRLVDAEGQASRQQPRSRTGAG